MSIKLYPLSAANGRAIPLEVIGPVSSELHAITDSYLASNLYDADYEDYIYMVYCLENIRIAWAATDTVIDSATQPSIIIPKETWAAVAPPLPYFNIATDAAPKTGTVLINTVTRWDTLTTPLQTDQG